MVSIKILKDREEWLDHRRNYIGGSDASCIVGLNPYKTNIDLWLEKTGQAEAEDISEASYVKYGTEAEEYLRKLFALDYPQYEVRYTENNSYTNDRYPWAAASLDGMLIEKETGRKGILEIKTSNILQSFQKEKWKDKIPDNYFCQVLHYLAVTEFDFVMLKAQLKSVYQDGSVALQTKHYHLERKDYEDDIQYLMEEEKKFWQCVTEGKNPSQILPEI